MSPAPGSYTPGGDRTTKRKTVSIEADVCRDAMLEAKAQNRTLSNYVNTLLRDRFANEKEEVAAW
ncbi:MAG: hypothetical protein JWM59_1294 [Verrucomicrobiales bacterium]|nr:hypothetical protein [Verrucomicrobiales bacterium]